MATTVMNERVDQRADQRIEPAKPRPRLSDRISETTCIWLGVAWVIGYLAVGALEPATDHALPVIAIVLAVAFHLLLLATAAGLIARRRWGLHASLAASGLFLAGTVACPTTGHHTIGFWWLGQMAFSLALVGASLAALYGAERSAGDQEGVPASRA